MAEALDIARTADLSGKTALVTGGSSGLGAETVKALALAGADVVFTARNLATAERFRKEMGEWYGADRARKVKHAEAFEICEYGRRPSAEELKKLFPFFDGAGGESR